MNLWSNYDTWQTILLIDNDLCFYFDESEEFQERLQDKYFKTDQFKEYVLDIVTEKLDYLTFEEARQERIFHIYRHQDTIDWQEIFERMLQD